MKKSFLVDKTIEPVYLGECRIVPLLGTDNLLVPINGQVAIRAKETLELVHLIGREFDIDEAESGQSRISCLYGYESTIIIARSHGLVEVFDIESSLTEPVRSWKTTENSSISFITKESGRIAIGFSDGIIRLYDVSGGFCIATLKGQHSGPITFLLFVSSTRILSAGEDGLIVEWEASKKNAFVRSVSNHKSAITTLGCDKDWIISGSRDGTLSFYSKDSLTLKHSLSILEAAEDLCVIQDGLYGVVGDKGKVRFFSTNGLTRESDFLVSSGQPLRQIIMLNGALIIVSSGSMIFSLDPNNLSTARLFVTALGEITDMQCLPNEQLAVSTGDSDLILFDSPHSLSCTLLKGHSGAIVSVAVCGDIIVTGSRDNCLRIWSAQGQTSLFCCEGHTDVVSAVAINSISENEFLIASGSSDLTIKLWQLNLNSQTISNLWTAKAHEKDINVLHFVSPQLLLSGSQDKLLKAWSVKSGIVSGPVMTGHRRGIWSISCCGDMVASGSSDKSIKIWSLSSRQCLKTIEGHNNSVLRLSLFSNGNNLVSVDSDGLVKLWDVKKSVCTQSFDEHQDRIWALALSATKGYFVTGDSTGVRKVWRDASHEFAEENAAHRAHIQATEQTLNNLIQRKEFSASLELTLRMDQPGRSLSLIHKIVNDFGCDKCVEYLGVVLGDASPDILERAFSWIREWNTNFKRSIAANLLLRAILLNNSLSCLAEKIRSMHTIAADIRPYIDRHLRKLQDLRTATYMADLALHQMDS